MKTEIVDSLLLYNIDEEDNWLMGPLSFPITPCKTYQEAFEQVKEQLMSEKVIAYIIEDNSLEADLFGEDSYFSILSVELQYSRVVFTFVDAEKYTVKFAMRMETISTVKGE